MLPDMDNMEASFVIYVNGGTLTHLQRSQNAHLTLHKPGIVTLDIQPDFIARVRSM